MYFILVFNIIDLLFLNCKLLTLGLDKFNVTCYVVYNMVKEIKKIQGYILSQLQMRDGY